MQTVKQVVCPRCQELNPANAFNCDHCGAEIAPRPKPRPVVTLEPEPLSDLPRLMWAVICAFLALWGLMASGILRGLTGLITHPYLLASAAVACSVLTGLFLAEKASREPPPDRLLSARDLMALAWTATAMLGATQFVKYTIPSIPVITRYEMAVKKGDGCRIEVFVKGETGDELWRLTGASSANGNEVVGIIVRRPGGGSSRLPTTMHTPQGDCEIVKYHLMIGGREADKVDGIGQ